MSKPSKDQMLYMYRKMVEIRQFEEAAGTLYQSGQLLVSYISILVKKPQPSAFARTCKTTIISQAHTADTVT